MTRILFLCGSPGFLSPELESKKLSVPFLFSLFLPRRFRLKKVHFSHCFIQKWEEIESLKNEKSPGILFSHFCTNPDIFKNQCYKLTLFL